MKKLLYSLISLVLLSNINSYGASSGFGIGLLAGTSKTKITNINDYKKLYNTAKEKLYNSIISNLPAHVRDMVSLSSLQNPFTEKSGFSFDAGATIFYQIGIKNFFIRPGIVCNFPVANNSFSCEKDNIKMTSNNVSIDALNNEISLTHSFDVGGQLVLGFTVAKIFSLVLGGEVGYTRWKAKINEKSLQSTGEYLHITKELSDGTVFWRGIIGCEFNIGNVILGLHAFAGPVKFSDKTTSSKENSNNNPDKLKLINGGARLMLAYKF